MLNANVELPDDSVDSVMDDKNRKREDGVQFWPGVRVRRISRASSYTLEEIIHYFGQSDEQIMRECELKQAIKDMYLNRRGSDNEFTTLGIDDRAGHGRAMRKANRIVSTDAVMDEQDYQYEKGISDDEMIAHIYSLCSKPASTEAQIKAQRLHDSLKDEDKKRRFKMLRSIFENDKHSK